MDVSQMRRWTVGSDVCAFPCKQVRVDDGRPLGSGRMLWDINYLYNNMQSAGENRTKTDFNRWFTQLLSEVGLQNHVVFRNEDSPVGHVGSLCTSRGLYSFFAGCVDKSRTPALVSACSEFLSQAARLVSDTQRSGSAIDIPLHHFLQQRHVKLEYLGADRIGGVTSWLLSSHGAVQIVFRESWQRMRTSGVVMTYLRTDTHDSENSFRDVVCFATHFHKLRRSGRTSRLGREPQKGIDFLSCMRHSGTIPRRRDSWPSGT